MNYIIFDKNTGQILAEAKEDQNLQDFMNNWSDSDYIESEESILKKISFENWKIDLETRTLVNG